MDDFVKLQLHITVDGLGMRFCVFGALRHNELSKESKGLFHYSSPLADIRVGNIDN